MFGIHETYQEPISMIDLKKLSNKLMVEQEESRYNTLDQLYQYNKIRRKHDQNYDFKQFVKRIFKEVGEEDEL